MTLSPPWRRVLALSMLACLLLVSWWLVISPLIAALWDRRADIDMLSDQLGRLHAIIVRRPDLERRAVGLENKLAAEGGFWTGASVAAIAADVQDRLRQAVVGSGGRVDSTAEMRETAEHDFHKMTIHFSIEGTLDTLQKTLAAIDASTPALFVDAMTISAPVNGTARDTPPILTFDLDVAGYMRGVPSG